MHGQTSCTSGPKWLGQDLERFPDAIGREMPSALPAISSDRSLRIGPVEYRDRTAIDRAIENFESALSEVKVA